jgi:hypothetical protein
MGASGHLPGGTMERDTQPSLLPTSAIERVTRRDPPVARRPACLFLNENIS